MRIPDDLIERIIKYLEELANENAGVIDQQLARDISDLKEIVVNERWIRTVPIQHPAPRYPATDGAACYPDDQPDRIVS